MSVAEPKLDTDDYYSDDTATFGDRVAAAREAAGLTQAQLARRLGVKRETVENWESDRSEPRANRLQMLAGLLNVSIIWLMSGLGEGVTLDAEDPEAEDAGEREVHDALAELNAIRNEFTRLTQRMARVEKRLRRAIG